MKRIAPLMPYLFVALMSANVICLSLAVALRAQAPATSKPPAITTEHRAEYFKRQLFYSQAAMQLQEAQKSLSAAVSAMSDDCGKQFRPQTDANGDPVCVAIPEPPKAPEKK